MMQFEYDELGRQTKRYDSMPGQATKTHLWAYDAQYYGNGYYIQKTAGKYQNGNLISELQSARYLFNTSGALTTREETQSVLNGGFDLTERFTYDTLKYRGQNNVK